MDQSPGALTILFNKKQQHTTTTTTTAATTTTTTISFPGRSVSSREGTHCGEGFFPLQGKSSQDRLLTPALPYSRFPALYRQDTTYAWSTDFG